MADCRRCARRLSCDWEQPPRECRDFRVAGEVVREKPLAGLFEDVRERTCRIRLPGGRRVVGIPKAIKAEDFILVQCDNGSIIVIEAGCPAEFEIMEEGDEERESC